MGARSCASARRPGARRENGEWIVETDKGEIRCEYSWSTRPATARRKSAEWFAPAGAVPMMAMSHQYLLTEEVPEIRAWTAEHGRKLPLLRDVDAPTTCARRRRLQPRPLRAQLRAHWITPDDPMPDDFSFQLYPDDLDRLEWYIEDAMERVPLLGRPGVSKIINGPIPYAPDGNPLIGPMPGVPNAFEACVFTFGIAQGGGAGKVLAEWITEGGTEWDMWSCDPRRFTDYTDQAYCHRQGHGGLRPRIRHALPAATSGPLPAISGCPRSTRRLQAWAARWASTTAGSARSGSRRTATTPRSRRRPRRGNAKALAEARCRRSRRRPGRCRHPRSARLLPLPRHR